MQGVADLADGRAPPASAASPSGLVVGVLSYEALSLVGGRSPPPPPSSPCSAARVVPVDGEAPVRPAGRRRLTVRSAAMGERTASVTREIKASPQAVWDAITDVTRMGEFSPECHTCTWKDGVIGPGGRRSVRGSEPQRREGVVDRGRDRASATRRRCSRRRRVRRPALQPLALRDRADRRRRRCRVSRSRGRTVAPTRSSRRPPPSPACRIASRTTPRAWSRRSSASPPPSRPSPERDLCRLPDSALAGARSIGLRGSCSWRTARDHGDGCPNHVPFVAKTCGRELEQHAPPPRRAAPLAQLAAHWWALPRCSAA